ncbi:hypothetical protein QCN29_34950 [Streptomyces sp. HNM0663]|uniref:PASTA domain-containing protein n=1 Tax=Streptomyces chengmaiensis TaxID=3040919 RepID=A0ABT6HZL7_9ACTN|nr:hypothetical protein [Streptomyces chengmaiensis]MDH2393865.1 hypothetical protein [Streptomyces chengmaiensis]
MRKSLGIVSAAVAGIVVLAGCEDGSSADGKAKAIPAAASSGTATAEATSSPSASARPTPTVPIVHGQTYRQALTEFAGRNVPPSHISTAALHKDVTLPADHDGWRVCKTTPDHGAALAPGATVVVKLAKTVSDCETSHHGYLHQKNDPAYTPPKPATPRTTAAPAPPKPAVRTEPAYTPAPAKPNTPAPVRTTTKPPVSGSMVTCPDGKQGYACTSNGHPVVDGQFCPNADRGRTLKATNGTMVTCSYDPSITPYRWQ